VRTGYPIAHEWQLQNGKLAAGTRLIPKLPFVCGGPFRVDNMHVMNDVQAMQFRASIANQIRDLPDGTSIRFREGAP